MTSPGGRRRMLGRGRGRVRLEYRGSRRGRPSCRLRRRTPVLNYGMSLGRQSSIRWGKGKEEKKTGQLAELFNMILEGRRGVKRSRVSANAIPHVVLSLLKSGHLHVSLLLS